MNVIIGFLENLDFDKGAEKISKKSGFHSAIIREAMSDSLKELFGKSKVPFLGPAASMRYPVGGFFFKMILPQEEDFKRCVLKKLAVNDSLKVKLKGSNYDLSIGILVMKFSADKNPRTINWTEDNTLHFARHVAALYRHKKEKGEEVSLPYFMIVSKKFNKEFPVDEDLDST